MKLLKKINIPKISKGNEYRIKWENEIKRAEAEWTESIKKYSHGKTTK